MLIFIIGLVGTALFLLSVAQILYFNFVNTGGLGGALLTLFSGGIAIVSAFSPVILWEGIGKITNKCNGRSSLFSKIRIIVICICVLFEAVFLVNTFKHQMEYNALLKAKSLLVTIDDDLESFANKKKIHLSRTDGDWSERSLKWENNGINCTIMIDEDKINKNYDLTITAYKGEGNEIKYLNYFIKIDVPFSEISDNFMKLLEDSYVTANSWSEKDLKNNTIKR